MEDPLRLTLIYLSMLVWYSAHVLTVSFGFAALIVYASIPIALSIFFGGLIIHATVSIHIYTLFNFSLFKKKFLTFIKFF